MWCSIAPSSLLAGLHALGHFSPEQIACCSFAPLLRASADCLVQFLAFTHSGLRTFGPSRLPAPSAIRILKASSPVKAGTVGTLRAKVPWTQLTSKPVTLALEDVVITVGKDTLNELVALERINKSRATSLRALDDVIVQAED